METLESKFEKLWEDKTLTNESFFNGMVKITEEFAVGFSNFCLDKILDKNYKGGNTNRQLLELYKQHLKENGNK